MLGVEGEKESSILNQGSCMCLRRQAWLSCCLSSRCSLRVWTSHLRSVISVLSRCTTPKHWPATSSWAQPSPPGLTWRLCSCLAVCAVWLVIQSCLTLFDSMDSSSPRSSVYGILQARTLEWVAISFSRGTSQSKDLTCISFISCIFRQIFYHCTT